MEYGEREIQEALIDQKDAVWPGNEDYVGGDALDGR